MVLIRLSSALLAAATLARALDHNKAPEIVPGAFVVEYENDMDTKSFVNSIDGAKLRKDLRFELFKGASIQFADAKQAEKTMEQVAEIPQVKNVWRVRSYPAPRHIVHSVGDAAGAKAAVLKRQSANDTFSTHVMTQVNKLRDAGITGKGIKIAVIDTGIDYLHPALGGCFGPGCLVSYGTDLVGDKYDGKTKPVPDPDPMDNCNGHGSHVAGIIAAQSNNPYGIIGGAQGVTLGAFRVFGCEGQVNDDVLIEAYLQAYEAGSDLITASLGSPSGWADDAWATVVSRIVQNGVPCVVAAGNEGDSGLFYASTAATGRGVTGIGSVDNTLAPALLSIGSYAVDTGASKDYGFTPAGEFDSWTTVTYPLWAVNYDTSDPSGGCDPYPDSTPDLTNHIVLVRRGNCTFAQKVQNAVKKGAKHVIVYNNVAGVSSISAPVAGVLAVAMVTGTQGADWISDLKAGKTISVTLPNPVNVTKSIFEFVNTDSPGFVSGYSSWGPSFEMDLKPQFSTPGGMILSTYPRALGAYAVLSGTSMACPLAAAIYALMMDARGTKDPKTIENALSATSKPIRWQARPGDLNSTLVAPVPQQGSGLIQVYDAAYTKTLLSASSLSFGDSDALALSNSREFTISNTGSSAVTYGLSHTGAATGFTFATGSSLIPATYPGGLEVSASYATITFSPASNFTIAPGARKVITVTAKQPAGLDAKRLPVYSGYISVSGSDGSSLVLPYIGAAGSLRATQVLTSDGGWVARNNDSTNLRVPDNTTFTLPPPGQANNTAYFGRTSVPKVVFTLAFGSKLVRADVVPLDNCTTSAKNATVVLGTKTIGSVDNFPSYYNVRNVAGDFAEVPWTGKLADGTYVQPGRYKLAFKALRIGGNPDVAADYDTAESQSFRVQYATLTKRSTTWKRRN
ncbi:peptidase S8/S53 domain-containing protein [Echria macrotheca]|uniref:Peptidase S8/S53 domain-containing protein n=1 Tax=Echria macrotheca TaxID=438768 RepID=A0AAJ0BDX9_9PEZI|nr:peptidase S8/S53 domain-containing protein [Echria macrotheca]